MKEIKWIWGIPLSLLSVVLLLLSFPPYNVNGLAFIALAPILFVVYRTNLKKTIGYGIVFAFLFYCLFLFWMNAYLAIVGVGFVTIVFGGYFILSLLFINISSGAFPRYRVIITPFIWIAFDYIRSFGFLGFTFGSIGYTQHNFPRFIQLADIGGEQLIAFIIVLFNAALAEILPHISEAVSSGSRLSVNTQDSIRRIPPYIFIPFIAAVGLIALSLIYGTVKLKTHIPEGPGMKLSLIQGLSSPRTKWSKEKWKTLRTLRDLSRESYEKNSDIDLIVWTETAIRTSLRPNLIQGTPYHTKIQNLIKELGTYFIIGSPDNFHVEKKEKVNPDYLDSIYPEKSEEVVWTNSAYFLNPRGEIIGKYDKIQLTPFGEHFPLGKTLPFLQKILDKFTDSAGFIPGSDHTIFEHEKYKFGVVICWEGTYGYIIRKFVNEGADFILNISNDMWTLTKAGHFQHFTMAKFRAIENRIWFVRAANDGVTAFINPLGIVVGILPIKETGYLIGEIGPKGKTTFYTKYGNILPKLSVAILIFTFVSSVFFFIKRRVQSDF